MIRPRLAALALFALCSPAAAQQVGGLSVAGPGMGPMPLQPDLGIGAPLRETPADIKAANPARGRSATHQEAIAKIRGDAGFLGGFVQGQPLAPSRQPPLEFPEPAFFTFVEAPVIVNSFGSPVSIDASGAAAPVVNASDSPVAINTGPGSLEQNNDSAVNIATGSGNVAQQTVVKKSGK